MNYHYKEKYITREAMYYILYGELQVIQDSDYSCDISCCEESIELIESDCVTYGRYQTYKPYGMGEMLLS